MKKLLGGIAVASILAIGAGSGLVFKGLNPLQVNAAVQSKVFIAGDMNDFVKPASVEDLRANYSKYIFDYIRTDKYGSSYYTLTFEDEIVEGQTFGLRDWEDGHVDWCASMDPSQIPYGLNQSTNLECTMTGKYKITYRFKDSGSRDVVRFEMYDDYKDVYVVNNANWSDPFIHAFVKNGADYTKWKSCSLRSPQALGSINVGENSYGFYRVRVKTDATHVIIGEGTSAKQTADLAASDDMVAFTGEYDADIASAAKILGMIVSNMDEAEHDNETFTSSICATPYSEASAIVTLYDEAGSTVKDILNDTPITTNNPNASYDQGNVSIESIRNQLAKVPSASKQNNASIRTESNSYFPIMIAIGSAVIIGAGGLFIARKRHIN